MEFERLVAVDWSGDKGPGQKKKIWAGVWTRGYGKVSGRVGGGAVILEDGRTREELTEWLIAMARETPRMVVSLDCCFSYPAWFLEERGCCSVFEFWQHVAEGHGEQWLGTTSAEAERDLRFWGRPHKRPEEFSGVGYARMMRRTDWENKVEVGSGDVDPVRAAQRAASMKGIQPKSPFQIGGSGSVGTGSLRAMPWLLRLHEAGFRVWPFEDFEDGRPMLVEMYTRLLTGAVAKSNGVARQAYLKARREAEPALYGGLSRRVLASAYGSEDGFDALVCCLEMVRYQAEFSGLRKTRDPVLGLEGITWRPGVME